LILIKEVNKHFKYLLFKNPDKILTFQSKFELDEISAYNAKLTSGFSTVD
jgi:hypothetical protein